jgi:hypothetical protein
MKTNDDNQFNVIVNGKQTGAFDKWQQIPLIVNSCSEVGSDDEKFNVLYAIRKIYDQKNRTDIRGTEGQTPAQVGRCEGFRELSYQRTALESSRIFIVPPVMQHLRLVPRSVIKDEINAIAEAGH